MNLKRNLISNRPLRYLLRLLLWSPVWLILSPLALELVAEVFPGVTSPFGACSAKLDILRGHYELKSNGLSYAWWEKNVGHISWEESRAWENRHRDLLRERYGIRSPGWQIRGCIQFQIFRDYRHGYDQTQRAAIAKKFGQNAITECALKVSEEMKIKPPPSPFAEADE